MAKETYYLACGYPLGVGSIVRKGNWGRICRLEKVGSFGQGNFKLIMELVFENVRLSKYPALPSRLDSIFLCPNEASMRQFVTECDRKFDLTYEVELVDKKAQTFETDWNISSCCNYVNSTITAIEQAAHRYWNPLSVNENYKEVLTQSDVKIMKAIKV